MTAREMFEELGFVLADNNEFWIEYVNVTSSVIFCKNEEAITTTVLYINPKILNAINQQVKELGW